MNRTIRVMAIVEMAIGTVVASIFVADRLGIAGPDSALTAILGLASLAVAAVSVACFLICLPISIRLLISSPPERTVFQIIVVSLAALLIFALVTWFIHISPYLRPH